LPRQAARRRLATVRWASQQTPRSSPTTEQLFKRDAARGDALVLSWASERPSKGRSHTRNGRYASAPSRDRDAPAYPGRTGSARLLARACSSARSRTARRGRDRRRPRAPRTRTHTGTRGPRATYASPKPARSSPNRRATLPHARHEDELPTRPRDTSATDHAQHKRRASPPQPSSLPTAGKPAAKQGTFPNTRPAVHALSGRPAHRRGAANRRCAQSIPACTRRATPSKPGQITFV
jgi:hypothetical protein